MIIEEKNAQNLADNEILALMVLSKVPGVGGTLARQLIAYCGSAVEVLKASKSKLLKIPGIGEKTISAIASNQSFEAAQKQFRFAEKSGIKIISYLHPDYPFRLKETDAAPLFLYYRGTANLNQNRVIGVVGTRSATAYGHELCDKLTAVMAPYRPLLVSGLAYGIDIHAHKGALKYGYETVGVLGHGLDRIYPSQHKSVAIKMMEQGGILTEFPTETLPDRNNFPARNRIIAGLIDALIVVEAAEDGGALITAHLANDYNRDVYAFPGRISDLYSAGCNKLIRDNRASILFNVEELPDRLGWNEIINPRTAPKLFMDLSDDDALVVENLSVNEPIHIDLLAFRTKFSSAKLASILLNLEFGGVVRALPGKCYKLV